MRLVGMPGETVIIRDGVVWIDGTPLDLPEELGDLQYEAVDVDAWGTPERPAQLRDNEYFVLGDFSTISKDSRYWHLEGYPPEPPPPDPQRPYVVPGENILGVATHVYWPFHRMRALRPQ